MKPLIIVLLAVVLGISATAIYASTNFAVQADTPISISAKTFDKLWLKYLEFHANDPTAPATLRAIFVPCDEQGNLKTDATALETKIVEVKDLSENPEAVEAIQNLITALQ